MAAAPAWRPQHLKDFPTLGWAVLEHASANLPDPNDEAGEWRFTDEQALRILELYRLDPDTGERVYRRSRFEEAKGRGKSPFAAVVAIEEFVGPVCFSHWDENGQPVGVRWGKGNRPVPWIQIAAVSEDQTENTYLALYQLLSAREGQVAKGLGIDLGQTRLHLFDMPGAKLEPVTASTGSREGQRITFAVLDETHLWLRRNGGVSLAATIRRNLGKMGGTSLETCNAPMLGSNSVAEAADDDVAGVLVYAERPDEEPQADWEPERLLGVLEWVYRNSPWVKPSRILEEVQDPQTKWEDALRYYFNIRAAGVSKAADPRVWKVLARPRDVPAHTIVGLGFDGSVSLDATVLRGCTAAGYRFTIRAWVRPDGPAGIDWVVPRAEVNAAIDWAFGYYRVGLLLYDPPYWYSEGADWEAKYGEERVRALDTNQASKFSPAVDRWRTTNSVAAKAVKVALAALAAGEDVAVPVLGTHDADPVATSHVLAAHLRKVRLIDADNDGRTRYVLVKGDDRALIDGAVADVLACEAAATMDEPPADAPFALTGRSWR
jgi:hypothetical protein